MDNMAVFVYAIDKPFLKWTKKLFYAYKPEIEQRLLAFFFF